MRLRLTARFEKDYARLSDQARAQVDKRLSLLMQDPLHPSLKKHKLKSAKGLWEIWITANYRVIFRVESETYVLIQVGTHKIIDRK